MKRGMKNKKYRYLFSCFFQEEVFKVNKITHPGFGSRIRIPNPGGKKAPDPGPWIWIRYTGTVPVRDLN
jgi:hypothetical protein